MSEKCATITVLRFAWHEGVDAALGLLPAPASGALVGARVHRLGARPAADRLVAAIEQRVVRHVVIEQVLPGVLARPRVQRVDLDERSATFALVELEHVDALA